MDIRVMDDNNPIYRGQTYRLKFKFPNSYPIGTPSHLPSVSPTLLCISPFGFANASPTEAPEVTFVMVPAQNIGIPLHPHIYSNGIICLDLLDRQGWSPVHNVQSVCMSLQSMLTGNTLAERPPGDEEFVRRNTQRPRDINFYFHDDKV